MDFALIESADSLSRSVELQEAIKRRIAHRNGRRIRRLEVEVVGTRLVIQGRATSFHLKQLAIRGLLTCLVPTAQSGSTSMCR